MSLSDYISTARECIEACPTKKDFERERVLKVIAVKESIKRLKRKCMNCRCLTYEGRKMILLRDLKKEFGDGY